jgi:hypothetical protein
MRQVDSQGKQVVEPVEYNPLGHAHIPVALSTRRVPWHLAHFSAPGVPACWQKPSMQPSGQKADCSSLRPWCDCWEDLHMEHIQHDLSVTIRIHLSQQPQPKAMPLQLVPRWPGAQLAG